MATRNVPPTMCAPHQRIPDVRTFAVYDAGHPTCPISEALTKEKGMDTLGIEPSTPRRRINAKRM